MCAVSTCECVANSGDSSDNNVGRTSFIAHRRSVWLAYIEHPLNQLDMVRALADTAKVS